MERKITREESREIAKIACPKDDKEHNDFVDQITKECVEALKHLKK